MSEFELDPETTKTCEDKLYQTGLAVNTAADRARDSVTGTGGSWMGMAKMAADNKQTGEFADIARKLHDEIEHISESLNLSERATRAEDEMNEQGFNNISPTGSYAAI